MAYLTSENIWRALVARIRADAALKAALKGGVHEGFAPEKTPYPLATWSSVVSVSEFTWDSKMIIALVDVIVYSLSSVEASNLDQSLSDQLDGAALPVTGQSTLICRRVADIRQTPDVDAEGNKVYGVGGSYEIWTDQAATT
jgi:hypothetical protein